MTHDKSPITAANIVSRRTIARTAAKAWRKDSEHVRKWVPNPPPGDLERRFAIADALDALGPNPDPDLVDRLVGSESYTGAPWCYHCEASGVVVVEITGENGSVFICSKCLQQAFVTIAVAEASKS